MLTRSLVSGKIETFLTFSLPCSFTCRWLESFEFVKPVQLYPNHQSMNRARRGWTHTPGSGWDYVPGCWC